MTTRTHRITLYSFLLMLPLLIASCSPRVHTQKVEDAEFAQFQTFAMLPIADTATSSIYHNRIVQRHVIETTVAEMRDRGYQLDNENPDILVLPNLRFEREEAIVTTNPYPVGYTYYYPGLAPSYVSPYYYGGYPTVTTVAPTRIEEREYTQGTLIIDIIRNNDDALIWRGWSREVVAPDAPADDLANAVESIFDEYPVPEEDED